MPVALAFIYAALCLLVAWFGRKRQIGFAGFFVLSVLLTPLIMMLVYLLGAPRVTR